MAKMLGRTASGLFWMMRYLERFENTARLIDAGFRMSLTRSRTARSEWESVLTTAGTRDLYLQKHDKFSTSRVVEFTVADPDNPSSLLNSMAAARENARMTRTALTRDVWEAINETYLQCKHDFSVENYRSDLPDFLTQIRQQAALVRGTINGTMLRNEIFRFVKLGSLIERADNTARILDTKYYVLLPSSASVGSSLDRVQWEMILRSASAERSFHWLYGGEMDPAAIIEFLIHDVRLPRSIAYCYDGIVSILEDLETEYDRRTAAHDLAAKHEAHLTHSTSETILGSGLHEFLVDFIARNAALSTQIETDFRFAK
ncbi:MAG: alpha-E domain-containing protein [Hyphomonadaceae bacterium]|nr:alpha-E domain-containing protein [Hyphomonadaceae bacterium]